VVAYGQILPASVLDAPRLGSFNLHGSLLPRWRGAAPIQRAVMAGDAVTGVQVMRMTPGLDEGPILLSESVRIGPLDTAGTMHDRLSAVGAHLLPRALAALERGGIQDTPQSSDGVTYARKITPAEARIDWTRPAAEVDRLIRGLSPFPGAWFEAIGDKGPVRVKVLLSHLEDGPESDQAGPGTVLDDRLLIACCPGSSPGAVRLLNVLREGRSAQDVETFLRGFPLAAGAMLA
jgi:methionyl-tRNA formyltransferase